MGNPYKIKELLNHSQWNSLRITLLSFEKNLRRAQAWLDGAEEKGTFYHRKLTLSAERRRKAQHDIEKALMVLSTLGESLEVPVENENVASEMRGEMTVSWTNLLDNRAGKLGRYGKVHPQVAGQLDAHIQQLAEIAQELSAIFGESHKEKPL